MADPLSIIAGVAGVATAAVKASKGLYDLVNGIKDAADEIETISRDSHAFYSIVFSLQVELQDEDVRNVIAGDEGLTTMVGNLQRPLSNCSIILGQILVKIKGHVKPSKGGHRIGKSDLRWRLYMKGDIMELVTQLAATKATLVTSLNALCMLCNFRLFARGNQTIEQSLGSNSTDAGFTLRRYVEESIYSSSIAPSSPGLGPIDISNLALEAPEASNPLPQSAGADAAKKSSRTSHTMGLGSFPQMLVSPNLPIEAPVVLPHVANITTQRKPDNVFEAVVEGNNLVVHGLLAEGVDTNVHNNEGQSPLGLAIEHGWDTIARILIEKANLDVLDSCCCYQLRTPLMLAAERENEDIVRLLLDNGANVNMANFCGYTPLIFATEQGNEHIIRLLLERGADASQMDQSGNTQLLIAAARGRDNVMSLLLNGMADVNHTDHWGYTALMVAAFELKKGAVRLLLDKGADAEARNNKGFTALDLVNGHRKEDARIIIKQNARIIAIKDTRIIRKWLEERQPSSYIDHHNSYLQI